MSTATPLLPPAAPLPPPPAGRWATVAEMIHALGDIPMERVRMTPTPGTVTFEQMVEFNEHNKPTCEWVENTLVEKPVGFFESWIGSIVLTAVSVHAQRHDLGMIVGEAAVMRILPGVGRAPDVAFLAWASLPGGRPPAREDRVPAVVPDLAVEVLSASNTPREMARKRDEYFRAGVKLVWEIDPERRTANVYTAVGRVTPVPADGSLDGAGVLPGFTLSLHDLFDRAERHGRGA